MSDFIKLHKKGTCLYLNINNITYIGEYSGKISKSFISCINGYEGLFDESPEEVIKLIRELRL